MLVDYDAGMPNEVDKFALRRSICTRRKSSPFSSIKSRRRARRRGHAAKSGAAECRATAARNPQPLRSVFFRTTILAGAAKMPWTANDAKKHTHKANSSELKELWAKVANESLERNGDEARAIREANAVIARQAQSN
jgi:hypothetical protein